MKPTNNIYYRYFFFSEKTLIFLVDRVSLVSQQFNVIKSNCDANVELMFDEMGIDKWSEENWKQILKENDVCA